MSESSVPEKKRKYSRTEMRRNARNYTLQAMYQWQMSPLPVNEIEAQFRVNNDMVDTDVALFGELFRGVTSRAKILDQAFSLFLDRTVDDLDPVELAVLRIGAYELIERPEVPYRVAINESVELAKTFGATESHRYVNGVLDKLAQKVRAAEVMARRER